MRRLAEEVRFVGGKQIDQRSQFFSALLLLDQIEVGAERRHVPIAQSLAEPRSHQALLAVRNGESGTFVRDPTRTTELVSREARRARNRAGGSA